MNMFVYRLNYCNHKINQIQYNIELLQKLKTKSRKNNGMGEHHSGLIHF